MTPCALPYCDQPAELRLYTTGRTTELCERHGLGSIDAYPQGFDSWCWIDTNDQADDAQLELG
jgi:hypothetical protein